MNMYTYVNMMYILFLRVDVQLPPKSTEFGGSVAMAFFEPCPVEEVVQGPAAWTPEGTAEDG